MEDQGFMLIPHSHQVQSTVAELRERIGKTTLAYIPKGKLELNAIKSIETLLIKAQTLPEEVKDDLDVNPDMRLTGARLSSLNQATAYKILKAKKMQDYSKRRQTKSNIDLIQEETKQKQQIILKESEIWKTIRHPDLHHNTRAFLWMAIHDAYMIGTNWLRPGFAPEYQERSECHHCHVVETMEHILTECRSPGQKQIWKLVKNLWQKKAGEDPDLSIGAILGNTAVTLKKKVNVGLNRLNRIVIAESSYLIWKLRCERVI
jgi:ribonuclease HI